MNRVNMRQTSSWRELNDRQARLELDRYRAERDELLRIQAAGNLTSIGKRQLKTAERKITEIEAEFTA